MIGCKTMLLFRPLMNTRMIITEFWSQEFSLLELSQLQIDELINMKSNKFYCPHLNTFPMPMAVEQDILCC